MLVEMNFYLSVMQIYATIRSGSLAIAASTLDSLLDLMAGGILWFTHLSMKSINIYKYPIGKLRVQPVGIIIFAAVMATLGMILKLHFQDMHYISFELSPCAQLGLIFLDFEIWE